MTAKTKGKWWAKSGQRIDAMTEASLRVQIVHTGVTVFTSGRVWWSSSIEESGSLYNSIRTVYNQAVELGYVRDDSKD